MSKPSPKSSAFWRDWLLLSARVFARMLVGACVAWAMLGWVVLPFVARPPWACPPPLPQTGLQPPDGDE